MISGMKKNFQLMRCVVLLLALGLMSACTGTLGNRSGDPAEASVFRSGEAALTVLLDYPAQLQRMSLQELARERSRLSALPSGPLVQIRLAMLFGHVRGATDLPRAQNLLEDLLKSDSPGALRLHPLARLLLIQYQERQRQEMQNEKLNQQLRESRRRNEELQNKIDSLAEIEHSLPARPRSGQLPLGAP